jgi:SH3 domain protein
MKLLRVWIIFIGFFLFVFSGSVYAETMYVKDILRLPLRTGQSTEYKIIAVIESGLQVEVLQSDEEWTQVRLPNEKEGWVQSRYLAHEPTSKIRLERLEIKHQNLAARTAALSEENTNLKREKRKLGAELTNNQNALNKINTDFESLKAESAEFLKLKTKYDAVAAELTEKSQKLEVLEEELSKIELYNYIKWFLAGSGVLLLGFIVGFSAKRQRRRPSLL